MLDPEKLIKSLIKSKFSKGKSSDTTGLGLGSLLNSKTLLVGLGAAGAAGAAYLAHKHFSGGNNPQQPSATPEQSQSNQLPPPNTGSKSTPYLPPPLPSASQNPTPQPSGNPSFFLVRAMIAAAHADFNLDEEERRRILGKSELFALNAEERQLLEQELSRPLSLYAVLDETKRLGMPPRQVYAASYLAISADTDSERAYLKRLAEGLGLSDQDLKEIAGLLPS